MLVDLCVVASSPAGDRVFRRLETWPAWAENHHVMVI